MQDGETLEQRRAEYRARFGAAQSAAYDHYLGDLSKYQARHNEAANALEIPMWGGDQWYQIPLEDCRNHRQLLATLRHLSEKTWFTVNHLSPLLHTWQKATGHEI